MALADAIKAAEPHQLALAIVGCLAAFVVLRSLLRAVFSPLRSVPGPFLARFTRLWYLRQTLHGDFHKTNVELHRKYGPIVRIAPGYYSIDDPAAVRTIYGHGTHFVKGPWYYASGNPDAHITDLFTDRDPKRHAANRRKVANLYSMTALLKMEEAVNECIFLIEERFREFARTGQVINLQYWLQCYAFDVIGAITVAKRFGFLDAGEDRLQMLPALHAYLTYATNIGVYPEVHKPLFRLLRRLGNNGMSRVTDFAQGQVVERLGSMRGGEHDVEKRAEGEDFLAKVLRLHEQEPRAFTMAHVMSTCATNIGAGSDTTSISLSGIMWGLVKNPEAYARLRAEVDERVAVGEASRPVTFAEAQRMPFLQAAVQEGLRIHPATGLPMGRVVPKGGAEIAGVFFPEGCDGADADGYQNVVGINSWVAHANQDVFGDDADDFKPERWLAEKERTQMMERYWLPFGHGSRTCVGKNISLMEMSKLVPELVQKFDFHLAEPEAELQSQNVWFVKQQNFMVRVSERKDQ